MLSNPQRKTYDLSYMNKSDSLASEKLDIKFMFCASSSAADFGSRFYSENP